MARPGVGRQSLFRAVMGFPLHWVGRVDPNRPFLTSAEGTLTYGDLAPGPSRPGQITVEPDATLSSVADLLTVPGPGRQLVVLDPRLPSSEKKRRLEAASAAAGRNALTILFTSGTTGPAKAVRLTAANWAAAVSASRAHLHHGPDDVWLATMPLHHVGGLSILYRTARVGARVQWLPRFDVATVVEQLRGAVTLASLVPTMLRRVLDHDRGRFSGVRAVLVGGGRIPRGLLEEAHVRGLPALPTYGMTETCAQVATLRPGSAPRYAVHPLPDVELRIGAEQRIEVRGPQISPGYAAEDDRGPGEWFVTSDRGELDEDGALRILGRADRVIVTGGEKVDPARVESILIAHPDVTAAAVVGIEDPEWGTAVAAAYEGTIGPDRLAAWARLNLSSYERPKLLRRLERMPTVGPDEPDRTEVEKLLNRRER